MPSLTRIAAAVATLAAAAAPLAARQVTRQAPPVGRFESRDITMQVDSGGRTRWTAPRGLLVAGNVRRIGEQLVFTDDSGLVACKDGPGRYTWSIAGDTLRFRVLEDPCAGRRGVLTTVWMRARRALVFTHATLIDGSGAAARTGMTVVTNGPTITLVAPDGAAALPADADVRDLGGKWLLPGLIDGHVHLATAPSAQDRRDRVEKRLRNALRGGVVAVRDMAGDGRALADLARAAAVGDIESPRIVYSAVFAGPAFFTDPRVRTSSAGVLVGSAPWARAISDSTDLQQVIAEARGIGATGVKLYGELDGALATRIAAEARRQRIQVWAHLALFPARPLQVVESGVHVVSHAPLLAWETSDSLPGLGQRGQIAAGVSPDDPAIQRVIRSMRERGVIFEPTLNVFRVSVPTADSAAAARREQMAAAMTRAVHASGVRISAGTDGIGFEDEGALPNIHQELQLLVERAGLTPMAALVAATRNAADAAGIAQTHGTIAVGKAADLLVLRADPLADIRNTTQIEMVVQRGRIVGR